MDYYGSPEKLLDSHLVTCMGYLEHAMSKKDSDNLFLADNYFEILWCVKQTLYIHESSCDHEDKACQCKAWILNSPLKWVIEKGNAVYHKIGLRVVSDEDDCWLTDSLKTFFILKQRLDPNVSGLSGLFKDLDFVEN